MPLSIHSNSTVTPHDRPCPPGSPAPETVIASGAARLFFIGPRSRSRRRGATHGRTRPNRRALGYALEAHCQGVGGHRERRAPLAVRSRCPCASLTAAMGASAPEATGQHERPLRVEPPRSMARAGRSEIGAVLSAARASTTARNPPGSRRIIGASFGSTGGVFQPPRSSGDAI